jgi:hypothetical protein
LTRTKLTSGGLAGVGGLEGAPVTMVQIT